MRNGGEKRGSCHSRRQRKLWMLNHFGNGQTVECVHCGLELTYDTVEADRITPGGSYARDNVQPSCSTCNKRRGNRQHWKPP